MVNETDSALFFSNDTALVKLSTSNIILATVFSFVNCFIVLANVIIIISIILSVRADKGPRERSIGKVLMVSMALSDFVLGVFTVPLGIYELVFGGKWYLSFGLCAAKVILDIYVCTVSIYSVTFMAVDRYLAVCRPLLHRTLTLKAGFIMASVSWLLPAVVLLCPFMFNNNSLDVDNINNRARRSNICIYDPKPMFQFVFSLIFIQAPVIFVFILYAVILRAIRQFQIRKFQFGHPGRKNLGEFKVKADVDSWPGRRNYGSWCCQIPKMIFERGGNRSLHPRLSGLATYVQFVVSARTPALSLAFVSLQTPAARGSPSAERKTVMSTTETRLQTDDNNEIRSETRTETYDNNDMKSETPIESDDNNHARSDTRLELCDNNHARSDTRLEICDNNHARSDTRLELCDNNHTRSDTRLEICDNIEKRQPSLNKHVANDALEKAGTPVPCPLSPRKQRLVEMADSPTAQTIKAVRTISIIIVCFTFCWMPMGWLLMVPTLFHVSVPEWIMQVSVWLGYLNSALNPIVYCSNTSIRQAVLTLICRCRRPH